MNRTINKKLKLNKTSIIALSQSDSNKVFGGNAAAALSTDWSCDIYKTASKVCAVQED